jgi:predicted DsbA family dithiol-disulfide isomerase
MQREVESGKYREVLNKKLAEGPAQNINAVPTYIINGKYSIIGAKPYEEFKRIIEQLSD